MVSASSVPAGRQGPSAALALAGCRECAQTEVAAMGHAATRPAALHATKCPVASHSHPGHRRVVARELSWVGSADFPVDDQRQLLTGARTEHLAGDVEISRGGQGLPRTRDAGL